MKTYQIALAVIAILVLNNLALLSYLGYFSEKEIANRITIQKSEVSRGKTDLAQPLASEIETLENQQPQPFQAQESSELSSAIENFVNSDQFEIVLENWQLRARQRNEELQGRLATMDTSELYTTAVDAQSRTEKAMAFSSLFQGGKLSKLSNQELKTLYTNSVSKEWGKTQLLKQLLENDDEDALSWAKASINDNTLTRGFDHEVFSVVYEKDPGFIKSYIAQVEFDPSDSRLGLFSFIQQEPELASSFYTRNLDQILDSKNSNVFMYGLHGTKIAMSEQQQLKIVDFFGSSNRHKRNFAISLVSSIEDTSVLRDAYSNLSRQQDKLIFLGSLLSPNNNAEASSLARELASNSDDPNIQRLSNAAY